MSQSVDFLTLPLEQLGEIQKQLDAEVDHLYKSEKELQQVLAKFIDCSQSVKTVSDKTNEGSEVMVPLTPSLYVPGKTTASKTFIVDVGTNYYVEKTGDEAVQFFDHKIKTLNQNLADLDKLLANKIRILTNVGSVYKMKFREALEKTEKEKEKV